VIELAEVRTLSGYTVSSGVPGAPLAIWDVELRPVVDFGGAVTHLLVLVTDVTAETAVSRRLDPLVALTSSFRTAAEPLEMLRAAVHHAHDLVSNDGSLVALAPEPGHDALKVVAASGVWSGAEQGIGHDLRLTLVLNVVRTSGPLELEWNTSADATETIRIVPLVGRGQGQDSGAPGAPGALGALAFARRGPSPFSAVDCQLIDELAGRLGLALERTDLRGTAA
jgi:GAF domain-containing protein